MAHVAHDDWVTTLGERLPASPLTALGLTLAALISLRAFAEGGAVGRTLLGVVVPLTASAGVVLADRWLLARGVPIRDRLAVFAYGLGGFLAAALVTSVHLLVVHLQGAPVYAPLFLTLMSGTVGVAAGTVAGIYERRQRDAAREARRQRERLDEFASVVSHDLRNPLGVARGRLRRSFETGDPSHLATVDEALARMDELIDDTLAVARAESAVVDPDPVDLGAVAREAWETVETGAATRSIALDRIVDGDRARLRTLFENLFRNCIEHGGNGVSVRIASLDAGFFVEDDGPGITPAEREVILERGYSTAVDGSGLGLAIVGGVADAHGWAVTVTDGVDGGARFEFTWA